MIGYICIQYEKSDQKFMKTIYNRIIITCYDFPNPHTPKLFIFMSKKIFDIMVSGYFALKAFEATILDR